MDVLSKILGSWSLILIASGILFNILVFFFCLKSNSLRKTSTFKLLAIGAINDILCSLPWNQENFTNLFFDFQSPYRSLVYCKFFSVLMQYVTLEFASWMFVSISFDRCMSLPLKKWTKHYFDGLRPLAYSIVMATVIIAINFNEIFKSGYSYYVNGTEQVVCYANSDDDSSWYPDRGERLK
jgi:hypothetical protein